MIPNRKVVGSNPAKDTIRTIFTTIGIYKKFILFLILFKKYSKHFLQLKRSFKKQAMIS